MQPLKSNPGNPINDAAKNLDEINAAILAIKSEREKVIQTIRDSAHNAVILFVDMVGSTKSKVDHQSEPEIWMFKVRQFYQVISEYVKLLGGRVVKYIGDEVMAVFDGDTQINDSANFVARQQEIEENLRNVTGETCSLKIAVDRGPVYCISLPGQEEPDVLGTPVDRCARIAKHAKPSVTLSSYDYRKSCPIAYSWTLVGEPELKGIGKTKIYQLGEKTVEIVEVVEIAAEELEKLKASIAEMQDQVETLTIDNHETRGKNIRLQERIEALGQTVSSGDRAHGGNNTTTEKEATWQKIEDDIRKLKKIINEASVPKRQYARFLFLHMQDIGEEYSRMEGKIFNEVIEEKLVEEKEGRYYLNEEHRRNKQAVDLMRAIEQQLTNYEETYRTLPGEEEELYDFSLSDPSFWEDKLEYNVRYI